MKTLQAKYYVILLAICVAIATVIVSLTKGKELALSVLLTGIGVVGGLAIASVIRKKTDVGKAINDLNPKVHRQLTTFLIIGAVLTMVGIALLVLYLR